MKKIFTLLTAVALGSLLWSCQKDKNDDPTPPPSGEATTLLYESFGTTAPSSSPYPSVEDYTGYSKTGVGAAKVEYVSEGGTVSVRTGQVSSGYAGASGSSNALLAAAGGAALIVKNIASCGASNLILSFGSNQTSDTLTVSYSADNGTTWTPITYAKGTTSWGLVNNLTITLPAGATCFALKFAASAAKYGTRVDDIKVTTTDAVGAAADCSGPAPSGNEVLDETLLTQSSFDKFTAVSVIGAEVWTFDPAYGAKMSGYTTATAANEDWFISPAMNLDGATSATLTFDHARGPAGSMSVSTSNYTLWISTDYTSGLPSTATWTQLTIPTYGTTAWTYVSSGQIALTQLAANTRFAFKYVCNDTESATWEIKNVVVRAEGVAPVPMLSFTSANSKSGTVGTAFTHTFTTQEANLTGATTFAVTSGTMPAGLSLSGATISGTPTTVATTPLTITATNGAVTANQTFTITITNPVTPGGNLLSNGSFETYPDDVPDSWTSGVASGATITLTKIATGAKDGTNAVKMAASGGTVRLEQVVSGITAGVTYRVSFWYKSNTKGQDNQGVRLWSNFKKADGANITPAANTLQPTTTLAAVTDWTQFTVDVVAPADATSFLFGVRATNGYEGIFDMCSITVVQ